MKTAAFLFTLIAIPQLAATFAETAALNTFLSDCGMKCDGMEKQKGNVRGDNLLGDSTMKGTRPTLLLKEVRSGGMPPEEKKQADGTGAGGAGKRQSHRSTHKMRGFL